MIAAMRAGDPAGIVTASAVFVDIDVQDRARRLLTWTPERTTGVWYHVMVDDEHAAPAQDVLKLMLPYRYHAARAVIEVLETATVNRDESLLHVATLPDDRVRCTWDAVAGADGYKLYRKLSGGAYSDPIYSTYTGTATAFTYTDGPLADGSYAYKLEAFDDEGDTSDEEETAVVTSTPEPPTGLITSWDAATHVLTLSWTASTSADVDHYAIRHNGGAGPVCIDDAAEDTSATTSWTIDLTGLTGNYQFLVRAVDADSHEEQNVKQMVAFAVVAGVLEMLPDVPFGVTVDAAASGKVGLAFWYYPANELNGPGAAATANVYSDAGTGTMDWVTPLDTVAMSNPTDAARWTWTSDPLADDTYLFAVRIETDKGTETTNDDTHEVATNDDAPAAVDLTVEVT